MTMSVMQPSLTGGEWAPSLHARVDLAKYATAVKTCKNFIVRPHGGVSNRGGTTYVGAVKDSAKRVRLVPFVFSVEQAYMLEFGEGYIRVMMDGGYVLSGGVPVEITTTYTEAQLPTVAYTQSADVLFLVHPDHPPKTLSRTSHTAWTLSTITFAPSVIPPSVFAGSTSPAVALRVTSVAANGEESVGSTAYNAAVGDTVTWSPPMGGIEKYNVYQWNGSVYGWVATVTLLAYTVASVTPDASKNPPVTRNPFASAGNYPGAVAFFEQRLLFGRTNSDPQTIWGSQVGAFNNMNVSIPLKDDDAYAFTIASNQVNEVKWFVAMNDLLIGTSDSEWAMGTGGNGAVTPTNVQMKRQTNRGCASLPPLIIGNTVLFVQRGGVAIRDMAYAFQSDGYAGNDRSILARHLFDGYSVTDWTYQQHPDSVVWVVRDDGTLLGLTYEFEHEVFGWHRHETDGTFEAIATIPGATGDDVYVIVNRTLNGSTVRCVEQFHPRLPANGTATDAYFVDCGLTYTGTPATVISGLGHLEGETVAILADGNVIPPQTVTSGAITLAHAASTVHVGLGYVSEVETLEIEIMGQGGTLQDRKRDVASVSVRLENTRALLAGPSADRLDEMRFREGEDYGDATALFTGTKQITTQAGSGAAGRVVLRNTDPLPVTILAIIPKVTYGRT